MTTAHTEPYVLGFQAARHEGPYADANADLRCPYPAESSEAGDWQRGFDDAARAQEASG